jgi:hypothetical protein
LPDNLVQKAVEIDTYGVVPESIVINSEPVPKQPSVGEKPSGAHKKPAVTEEPKLPLIDEKNNYITAESHK